MSLYPRLSNAPVLVRLLVFAGSLATWWGIVILALTWFGGLSGALLTASLVPVYLGFVVGLWLWGRFIYGQIHPLRFYGWDWRRSGWRECLWGWGLGLGVVMGLFVLQGWLGGVTWHRPPANIAQIAGEGLLVASLVACVEELLFRGWLLQELERDYTPPVALISNSFLFAALHNLRPWEVIVQTWTQILGLFILGMVLVWCRRLCAGRLSLAVGVHGGLVWGYYLLRVGQLTQLTQRLPTWVTGINDNPLAGGLGLVLLSGVAVVVRHLCHRQLTNTHNH